MPILELIDGLADETAVVATRGSSPKIRNASTNRTCNDQRTGEASP